MTIVEQINLLLDSPTISQSDRYYLETLLVEVMNPENRVISLPEYLVTKDCFIHGEGC